MAKTSAVLKKPAAGGTSMVKKPATKVGKRPAALGLPVKSKKRKEEEETEKGKEEEVATEDPEEGSEEESEKEAQPEAEESKPKVELSETALKDWDLFVAEVQKNLRSPVRRTLRRH